MLSHSPEPRVHRLVGADKKPSDLSTAQLSRSVVSFLNPWTAARQASLSITNSCSLLKLMSIELVMPSPPHPLSSPSPALNLSQHQGFF